MTVPQVKGYSFIEYPMDKYFVKKANEYIEKNYNKTVFEYKGNLFDIKSLNKQVNLDCLNCHFAHTKLCCEGGSPYPPNKEDIRKVKNIASDILKQTQTSSDYIDTITHIKENGLINNDGSFTSNCGKCVFFIKEKKLNSYVCAIHSFALKNNIDYTSIKPKGCMMYPIDILDLTNGNYFIFGADEETVVSIYKNDKDLITMKSDNIGFSRWNSYDLQFLCLDKKERKLILEKKVTKNLYSKSTLPDNMFRIEDYISVYQQEKKLITSLYGEDTYEFIAEKSIVYSRN